MNQAPNARNLEFVGPNRQQTLALQKKFKNKHDLYKYFDQVLVSNKFPTPSNSDGYNVVTYSKSICPARRAAHSSSCTR